MFVVAGIDSEMSLFLRVFCVCSSLPSFLAFSPLGQDFSTPVCYHPGLELGKKKKKNPHSIPENRELSRFQRVSPQDPAMAVVDDVRGVFGLSKATKGRSSS